MSTASPTSETALPVRSEIIVPGPSPAGIHLSFRPRPFELEARHCTIPADSTIAEAVEYAFADPLYRACAVVTLNGRDRIPREMWDRVRVKNGQALTIVPLPENGRQVLTAVLIIAIAVAAAYTGGAAAGLAGGGFWGGVAGAAVSTAVTVAGPLTCGLAAPLPPGDLA